jgi:hypothetical protein
VKLFILLFIITATSWAQVGPFKHNPNMFKEVMVFREGDAIKMRADTCEMIEKQTIALTKWSHKKENFDITKCDCPARCEYDVSAFVPDFVYEAQGVCPMKPGPNCWNTSLVSAGITSKMRYTSSEEMNFWMTSPLCRERANDEEIQAGDIIAIRDQRGQEVHGFVHLTNELSYSKNGYSNHTWFSLQSPENVYRVYDVEKECQGLHSNLVDKKVPPCKLYSNIIQCISMDEYLKNQKAKDNELLMAMKQVDQYECHFGALIMDYAAVENLINDSGLIKVNLEILKKMAEDKLADKSVSDEDKFLWQGIKIKNEALLQQIDLLNW